MTNGTPIPFLGWWVEEDIQDVQQMLRDQIGIQQQRITELEGVVKMLQEECSILIKQLGETK